jgi:hypothetical protein
MGTWLTMTRWQIKTWRLDKEGKPFKKQCRHDCKLCALNCAFKQVIERANRCTIAPEDIGWTASRLVGAPGQWEIVFHDRQELGELPVRHGH